MPYNVTFFNRISLVIQDASGVIANVTRLTRGWSFPRRRKHLGHPWSRWSSSAAAAHGRQHYFRTSTRWRQTKDPICI